MNRPFPDGWSFRQITNKVRANLPGKGFTLPPVPPKGPRASGPQLPPLWHEPLAQAEMALQVEGLLSQERCAGCGRQVLAATGKLHREHPEGAGWCGFCFRTRVESAPPPAAA